MVPLMDSTVPLMATLHPAHVQPAIRVAYDSYHAVLTAMIITW